MVTNMIIIIITIIIFSSNSIFIISTIIIGDIVIIINVISKIDLLKQRKWILCETLIILSIIMQNPAKVKFTWGQ